MNLSMPSSRKMSIVERGSSVGRCRSLDCFARIRRATVELLPGRSCKSISDQLVVDLPNSCHGLDIPLLNGSKHHLQAANHFIQRAAVLQYRPQLLSEIEISSWQIWVFFSHKFFEKKKKLQRQEERHCYAERNTRENLLTYNLPQSCCDRWNYPKCPTILVQETSISPCPWAKISVPLEGSVVDAEVNAVESIGLLPLNLLFRSSFSKLRCTCFESAASGHLIRDGSLRNRASVRFCNFLKTLPKWKKEVEFGNCWKSWSIFFMCFKADKVFCKFKETPKYQPTKILVSVLYPRYPATLTSPLPGESVNLPVAPWVITVEGRSWSLLVHCISSINLAG